MNENHQLHSTLPKQQQISVLGTATEVTGVRIRTLYICDWQGILVSWWGTVWDFPEYWHLYLVFCHDFWYPTCFPTGLLLPLAYWSFDLLHKTGCPFLTCRILRLAGLWYPDFLWGSHFCWGPRGQYLRIPWS